jgi:hypothetical protein
MGNPANIVEVILLNNSVAGLLRDGLGLLLISAGEEIFAPHG